MKSDEALIKGRLAIVALSKLSIKDDEFANVVRDLKNAFEVLDKSLSHGGNPPEDWLFPFKRWLGKCPSQKD
ncbi:MAG TPA: hypothetical protein VII94_03525 [Candidatus Saccharimonadales bacterium]